MFVALVAEVVSCCVAPQATVLSSHRQFLRRLDLLDISRGHGRGDHLALYIFSDSMEVGLSTWTSAGVRGSIPRLPDADPQGLE